jgi:hypothetical protein
MQKHPLDGSAILALLWLTLAFLGCSAPGRDMGSTGVKSAATAGASGGAGAKAGVDSAGSGNATGFAGSNAIGIAGRGGSSSSAGTQNQTGGRSADDPRSNAGRGGSSFAGSSASGSAGPIGGGAGSRASGSAGTSAAGSGGSGAATTGPGRIWMPKPGVSWQWQLTGTVDTSVDAQMFDIDLFTTSPATIETLHAAGKIVVCYFSAGSYEPDRPDSEALSRTGLGSTLDGWPDEKWLDIRSAAVRDLMKARLDVAKSKACDGVEPDNVDGFDNDNGLGLTQKDALDYDRFLATESHARGLSIGLKNSLGLAAMLVSSFDWALNEECLQYAECDNLQPFIAAGKAVFHCEYAMSTNGICGKAPQGFSTIVKNLDLDAFRLACN